MQSVLCLEKVCHFSDLPVTASKVVTQSNCANISQWLQNKAAPEIRADSSRRCTHLGAPDILVPYLRENIFQDSIPIASF